jgi:hypothetical protein
LVVPPSVLLVPVPSSLLPPSFLSLRPSFLRRSCPFVPPSLHPFLTPPPFSHLQTFTAFINRGIVNVGVVHGDHFEPAHVTICTAGSIEKLNYLIPEIKAVIIDEVHQFSSSASVKMMKRFDKAVMKLGFSATPWKDDDEVLGEKGGGRREK